MHSHTLCAHTHTMVFPWFFVMSSVHLITVVLWEKNFSPLFRTNTKSVHRTEIIIYRDMCVCEQAISRQRQRFRIGWYICAQYRGIKFKEKREGGELDTNNTIYTVAE